MLAKQQAICGTQQNVFLKFLSNDSLMPTVRSSAGRFGSSRVCRSCLRSSPQIDCRSQMQYASKNPSSTDSALTLLFLDFNQHSSTNWFYCLMSRSFTSFHLTPLHFISLVFLSPHPAPLHVSSPPHTSFYFTVVLTLYTP